MPARCLSIDPELALPLGIYTIQSTYVLLIEPSCHNIIGKVWGGALLLLGRLIGVILGSVLCALLFFCRVICIVFRGILGTLLLQSRVIGVVLWSIFSTLLIDCTRHRVSYISAYNRGARAVMVSRYNIPFIRAKGADMATLTLARIARINVARIVKSPSSGTEVKVEVCRM